jgi:hypothetical protein
VHSDVNPSVRDSEASPVPLTCWSSGTGTGTGGAVGIGPIEGEPEGPIDYTADRLGDDVGLSPTSRTSPRRR